MASFNASSNPLDFLRGCTVDFDLNTGLSKEALAAALDACDLPQNVRGEKLGIPEFAALTKALRSAQ